MAKNIHVHVHDKKAEDASSTVAGTLTLIDNQLFAAQRTLTGLINSGKAAELKSSLSKIDAAIDQARRVLFLM